MILPVAGRPRQTPWRSLRRARRRRRAGRSASSSRCRRSRSSCRCSGRPPRWCGRRRSDRHLLVGVDAGEGDHRARRLTELLVAEELGEFVRGRGEARVGAGERDGVVVLRGAGGRDGVAEGGARGDVEQPVGERRSPRRNVGEVERHRGRARLEAAGAGRHAAGVADRDGAGHDARGRDALAGTIEADAGGGGVGRVGLDAGDGGCSGRRRTCRRQWPSPSAYRRWRRSRRARSWCCRRR